MLRNNHDPATNDVRLSRPKRRNQSLAALCTSLCITALFAVPSTGKSDGAQDTNISLDSWRSEASAGLKRLESDYVQLRGNGTLSMQNIHAGVTRVHDLEFAIDGDKRRLIETISKYKGPQADRVLGMTYAKVIGPVATFQLRRRSNVQSFETQFIYASAPAVNDNLRVPIDNTLQLLFSAFRVPQWMLLRDLLSHSGFQTSAVSRAQSPSGPVLRVEFTVTRPENVSKDPLFKHLGPGPFSGWFELLPEQSWAVRACEYGFRDAEQFDAIYRRNVKYRPGPEHTPVISESVQHMLYNGQPLLMEQLALTAIERQRTPAEEFSPAAFGLVADVPVPAPGSRNFLWLWIVIALLLVAGVVMSCAARRKVAV